MLTVAELDLVRSAQAGDTGSRDRLLEETYTRLYRYLARLAGDRAMAEDLAQETMVRVLRSMGTLREPDRFLPWVLRIGLNLWRDAIRRRPIRPEPPPASEPGDDSEGVRRAVARLEEPYRTALTLRYLEGLDYDAMASVLELNVNTLKSQVARGLRLVRASLESIR